MINGIQRRVVEMVKTAKTISITTNEDDRLNSMSVLPISDKRFAHDVALALQTYYNNND